MALTSAMALALASAPSLALIVARNLALASASALVLTCAYPKFKAGPNVKASVEPKAGAKAGN